MANETFSRDPNHVPVVGGVTNDASAEIRALRIDDSTKRLLVTAEVTAGGGGTQYDIDDAAGATDTGTLGLVIRDDALATLTPADGDYTGLRVDSTGRLWANVSNTVTVDGSGVTQPISHSALTELAAAINGSVVDVNTELGAAAALLEDTDPPTVPWVGAFMMGYDYSGNQKWNPIRVDGFGIVDTRPAGSESVGLQQNSADGYGLRITGGLAHDAIDGGGPLKIGGYASATAPSGVSGDADRVNAWFLRNGAQATVLTAAGALIGGDAANGLDVDITRLPAGTNAIGRVGHDVTGIAHGVKTVTAAGTDEALAGSTACKKVDIQAQTDNTGLIAVGGSGVDATVSTGTGVILYAGDVYSIEIDNLADVFIDSTVSGEGVRYTYYT